MPFLSAIRRPIGKLKRALHGWFLNQIESTPIPPEDLKPIVLGRSHENREIECYKMGRGAKKILIFGGMHGNEVGSIKAVYNALSWLHQHETAKEDFNFFVIPCLNPDGYAKASRHPDYWKGGRIGRFNANGVDLNRNFPAKSWQKDADWTHGANYTDRTAVHAGDSAGSEPELQTLIQFVQEEKPDLTLSFHTAAADIMGNDHPLAPKMAKVYAEAAQYRLFTLEEWPALEHTGSTKEWFDEQNLALLEIEGTTRWGSDWKRHRAGLEALLEKMK